MVKPIYCPWCGKQWHGPCDRMPERPNWKAHGFVKGAVVLNDVGKRWVAEGKIIHVHDNGALDVESKGQRCGWSARRCTPINVVYGAFRMNTPTISFTPEKLEELKAARNKAIEDGKDVFLFEGQDVLVDYAKYMIEYLENQFRHLRFSASPETIRKYVEGKNK